MVISSSWLEDKTFDWYYKYWCPNGRTKRCRKVVQFLYKIIRGGTNLLSMRFARAL